MIFIEFGTTKTGYMWHIIKNDGKALCNPSLNINLKTVNAKAMICNRCEASSELKRNAHKLQPINIDGAGI